jgi:hypothetical protein
MTRILIAIDEHRRQDDEIALIAIATGLRDAGIEQIHLLAEPDEGRAVTPLVDDIDCLSVPMPQRWWSRTRIAAELADTLARRPVDLVLWSGADVGHLAQVLATVLEVPLIADVWQSSQIDGARRFPLVDAWIARTEAVGSRLRSELQAGTVITARPPLNVRTSGRLPDRRPAMVVLDPGHSGRQAAPLLEALSAVIRSRPDIEVILELQGGASHKYWKMIEQRGLLEHASVLDRVGTMGRLVAEATIVVAPDPSGPARSLIPIAMCGGAAVLAASNACEEFLEHDVTAILVDDGTAAGWESAMLEMITDPPTRQRLAHEGQRRAMEACRPDVAMDAWLTAITTTMEPEPYPLAKTQPAR